jgi:hypothetical protein
MLTGHDAGIEFRVYGHDVTELFHAQLATDVSDLPASRKLNALQGFTSTHFMSHVCTAKFNSLVDPDAFKPECRYLVPCCSQTSLNLINPSLHVAGSLAVPQICLPCL